MCSLTGSKEEAAKKLKPRHAIIWVAKNFPPWQDRVLHKLHELLDDANTLPDNRTIVTALKDVDIPSKHKKKLMPFVALLKVGVYSFG